MNDLITFLLAAIGLTLLPGPDFMAVVTLAMTKGGKQALTFASGLCSGLIVHILGAATGLGLILKTSPVTFEVVRWLGLSYLVWLGYLALRSYLKETPTDQPQRLPVDSKGLYRRGVMMNILNPKVTLFFLSFFPQFIKTELGVWGSPYFLGLLFIIQAMLIFATVVGIIRLFGAKIKMGPKRAQLFESVLYFAIALMLVF